MFLPIYKFLIVFLLIYNPLVLLYVTHETFYDLASPALSLAITPSSSYTPALLSFLWFLGNTIPSVSSLALHTFFLAI